MSAPRIDVHHARVRSATGQALLVCAYDDEDKCATIRLADSISIAELRRRHVDPQSEIILYCS